MAKCVKRVWSTPGPYSHIHTPSSIWVMDSSADGTAPPPGRGGGFFRRLFEWRATYRPDEPRMSRWRWWVVFVFLPPIALAIIWSDKKFLKQMALAIFYMSTLFLLVYLFVFAGIIGYAQGMAGLVVLLTPAMPWHAVRHPHSCVCAAHDHQGGGACPGRRGSVMSEL